MNRQPALGTRGVVALLLCLAAIATACSRSGDGGSAPSTSAAPSASVCDGPNGVGSAAPSGTGPGDLVSSQLLEPTGAEAKGFPANAKVWRVLYVSIGVDENDRQLVCGLVAAPASGLRANNSGRANVLAWSHGTVGLDQRCLPSSDPKKLFWGPMPGGIGAIGVGKPLGEYEGTADSGALQFALDQGWMVAAADYQPKDTYVLGRVAAANVLDSVRAASQLVAQEKLTPELIKGFDMVTWGHSQGGHAALWAGQMADTYYAATSPAKPTPPIELAGVVALAPASTFIGAPGTGARGLADWEMHKTIEVVGLPIPKLELQIGPALFSYIFGSWSTFSTSKAMTPGAKLPAFPENAPLDRDAMLTKQGQDTVGTVTSLCLETESKQVQAATSPYRNAEQNQMLVPAVWNLPQPYRVGQFFPGGLDATCAAPTGDAIADWCQWITWNLPGPRGTSPYPKIPTSHGKPVPVLIAQGMDDSIIHCVPSPNTTDGSVPAATDCMSAGLFEDLKQQYCATDAPAAYLHLLAYRKDGSASPASHLSIPGQSSTVTVTKDGKAMRFAGSPVQMFMSGAFGATLAPGCVAEVANP
ncbi:MAG: lipase family protein [Nocardiaceae bacterium]|nr:lipase family protein [Nocardiaceae bacterium]